MNPNDTSERKASPGVWKMTISILAAFVGIQNNSNHDVDDAHIEQVGFKPYIVIGVVMTVLFVLLLVGLVQLVLRISAGS